MATPRLVPRHELRHRTADVPREVGAGPTVRITVSGRPAADLTRIRTRARYGGSDVLDRLYELPEAGGWPALRNELRRDEPEDPGPAPRA